MNRVRWSAWILIALIATLFDSRPVVAWISPTSAGNGRNALATMAPSTAAPDKATSDKPISAKLVSSKAAPGKPASGKAASGKPASAKLASGKAVKAKSAPNAAAPAAGYPRLSWPGPARADLAIPDSLWDAVLAKLGRTGRPIGFTTEEMANYGHDDSILRTVRNLFHDVRAIPRFSGKLSEDLIQNAQDPAELVTRAYALTDVSAGRNIPLPDSLTWGPEWVPKQASPLEALEAYLRHTEVHGDPYELAASERAAFAQLPLRVQRLVVRIVLGADDAAPWLEKAYDDPVFAQVFEAGNSSAASGQAKPPSKHSKASARNQASEAPAGAFADTAALTARYHFAMAPWRDARLDQPATLSRTSLEMLDRFDRDYMAFGSVVFLAHFRRALREYQRAGAGDSSANAIPPAFRGCRFTTPLGPVHIFGTGRDTIDDRAFFTLDLGGDDLYRGVHGVPLGRTQPIGLVLDLAGNDTYEGGPEPASLSCGLFGLGAIFDLSGDDHYRCAEAGLGMGCFGTGILMDFGGNDTYTLDTHEGEGMGMVGVGLLVDQAGDDHYVCGYDAQGLGSTLGAGFLIDVKGNDSYLARDDGNPDPLYNGLSVSMAQGVGQGRRADLGDGHSLAGGIGVLVDGAGDDSYHATAWSDGAGYWWSLGILEDLGGNDTYRNGKYSLGAGAHFAIGCQVDLSGDDRYNVDNDVAVNQYQGHARDGSIGISIDGDGNDEYYWRSHCGGSADLNSIGLFWDRRGNDVYHVRYELLGPPNGWTDTPPMGTATRYTPFRSFRDDLESIGIFMDTQGQDVYQWEESDSAGVKAHPLSRPDRGNNLEWLTRRAPNSKGLGIDQEIYPARP